MRYSKDINARIGLKSNPLNEGTIRRNSPRKGSV